MSNTAVADNFKLLLKSDEDYLEFLNNLVSDTAVPGFEFTIDDYGNNFSEWVGCTYVERDDDLDENEEDMSTGYEETVFVGKDTDQIRFVKVPQVRPVMYPCIVVVGEGADSGAKLTFVYPEDFRIAPQEARLKVEREDEKLRTLTLLRNIGDLCHSDEVKPYTIYDQLVKASPSPRDEDFRKVERAIITVMGPDWLDPENYSRGTNRYKLTGRITKFITLVKSGDIPPNQIDKNWKAIAELALLWGYSSLHPDNRAIDWASAWDFGFNTDKKNSATEDEDEFPLIVVKQED